MFCIKKIKQKRNTFFGTAHQCTYMSCLKPKCQAWLQQATYFSDYFVLKFPEKGLWCSEGGRIFKQLLWKVAKNHLTQLSTAHKSKRWAVSSAGWGFHWLLHDFVWQEVGRSLCLEEVKGLLCFFVSCRRAWSISNDTAFCLHLYSECTPWDHEVHDEKRKTAEERSFWTHIKIFEKSDGEGKSTRSRSAACLSGHFQKKIWQINVTGMIKLLSHWEEKGNNWVAKPGNRKRC